MTFLFPPVDTASLEIIGLEQRFPVRRIYCVGANYSDHVREMGVDPKRSQPFFFSKPVTAMVPNGATIPYPSCTENLHHEIELVVALHKPAQAIAVEAAAACIYGYAVGNDLTRRDLQTQAKEGGRPWETGKGFENSAPLSALMPRSACGTLSSGEISLSVNGVQRQCGDLAQMTWNVDEIIAELSRFFPLYPGDLIFTGTPAGVGAVGPGDVMEGYIEGVGRLSTTIAG